MFTITDFSFCYPKQDNYVLNTISLTIESGEFIVVCGKSGCGKTTLLKNLKHALLPVGKKTGTITYFDKSIEEISLQEETEIGYVFQNPDDQMVMDKVWHELAFGLENMGVDLKTMKRRIGEIVNYFHLQDLLERNVHDLSGGEKQMINLASIMAMNPKVILLDEALAQLDPIHTKNFVSMLKAINEDFGVTIILVEHQLEEVLSVASRVILMEQGCIIQDGNVEDTVMKMLDTPVFEAAIPDYMKLYTLTKQLPMSIASARILAKQLPTIVINEQQNVEKELLSIKELSFGYQEMLLKNISLAIYQHDFLTIVGGNGSGKTTLLKCLVGLLKHRGKWQYHQGGKTCKWGYVPQDPTTLFLHDTVLMEVSSICKDKQIVEDILKTMNLDSLKELHPYDLSGGQKQLLAIAKILLTNPDILALDEPTKGIDAIAKQNLGKLLQSLNNKMAIICVSHDLEFSALFSKRVGMLFNGQIETLDTTRNFFKDNLFYTTTMNKVMKDINHHVITFKDLIE